MRALKALDFRRRGSASQGIAGHLTPPSEGQQQRNQISFKSQVPKYPGKAYTSAVPGPRNRSPVELRAS
jgi:hypothetical protein